MDTRRQRRCCGLAVLVVGLLSPVLVAEEPPGDQDAEAAIRAQIDKFNSAWQKENGVALIEEVVSEKAFTLVMPRSSRAEARVLNRAAYSAAFQKLVQEAGLRKHEHQIQSITVLGPIAYELGIILDVANDGTEQRTEVLNVFAKEDAGWKLVFSTTPDLIKKVREAEPHETESVRILAKEFVGTFRTQDPTPFARFEELLADDVVAIQSDGSVAEGKPAVVKFYRAHLDELAGLFRTVEISWEGMSVKLLGGGATVTGKLLIKGERKEDGRLMPREERETLIFRKSAKGWHLIEEHCTVVPQPAPAAAR